MGNNTLNLLMRTVKDLLANQRNDRHKMRYIFDRDFKMLRFDYT